MSSACSSVPRWLAPRGWSACVIELRSWTSGGERFSAHRSQILQLRKKLMEGATPPTWIARPRPRHGGTIERARDRVLDGACSYFCYRVTTVL